MSDGMLDEFPGQSPSGVNGILMKTIAIGGFNHQHIARRWWMGISENGHIGPPQISGKQERT
jgi:hypothetical protein